MKILNEIIPIVFATPKRCSYCGCIYTEPHCPVCGKAEED